MKKAYFVVIGIIVLIVSGGAYYLNANNFSPSNSSTVISPSIVSVIPTNSVPPPLAKVKFPESKIEYPASWPPELQYPSEFILVEATSGKLPEDTVQGWAAKLRYKGSPANAANAIMKFLGQKGWNVADRTELDTGSILLLIENNKSGTGNIVIDRDIENTDYTRIVSTIFP